MEVLDSEYVTGIYPKIKEEKIQGRWVTFKDIHPVLEELPKSITKQIIGSSEQGTPIYKITLGSGSKKILIWSQMHGNESTGTKAVFDFINFIKSHPKQTIVKQMMNTIQIHIIPMLNPDGALAYTRENSNGIDLNRDAVALKAKESILLRKILEEVHPDFCFNLHDQRTIFGVEGTKAPASISFLAPSEEITRKLTKGRKKTMNVIIAMNALLQQIIPGHVGRYTDEFYPTATGDNFQKLGYNTVLIEAGHFPNDYEREKVREFNFYALLQGLFHVVTEDNFEEYKEYFTIPNNIKNFYDVIFRMKNSKKDIAYQYVEKIENNKFALTLKREKKGDLSFYLSHKEFNINS